jgi:serine/threonine protein kinase
MAPEQLEGDEVGPATDVYSLAVVAFEALAGRRARQGRTPVEVAHALATEPPPDLRDAWPHAPPAAAGVLRRAMARDPGERPASACELADELGDALAEAPLPPTRRFEREPATASAPPPVPGRPAERRPREPRRLGLPGIALIAVFVALAADAALGAILDDGGDKSRSENSDAGTPQAQTPDRGSGAPAEKQPKKPKKPKKAEQEQPPPPQSEEQPPPAAPAPAPDADGASLNKQGFTLMNQGRYDEAIPVLQRAVNSLQGSGDLNYAYALYNLGRSLRLAGRLDEAIPVLEQRLQIRNQTGVVRRELEAARREAG